MTTPLLPSDPVRIGPYTVAARIDSGGQGTVYLAHASDGSPAAVKVLTRSWAGDTRQRERFAKELAAARRVAPFCTAAVLDADMDADVPFIASEYVPGPTLRSAVRDAGPHTGPALDRLAIATVTALAAVHEAGVVHRDLKPGNVILGPDGPRVIDFGIASLVDATQQTTTVAGTPSYMSPEQVRGGQVGPSSDMFSWAAVIAYAATGHHAFPGEDTVAVIDRVLTAPPELAGVPDRLLPVLEACLAKDPVSRPAAVEVLGALIGRSTGLDAPLAATRILAEASTAVDDDTARIRLPEQGWRVPDASPGGGGTPLPPEGVDGSPAGAPGVPGVPGHSVPERDTRGSGGEDGARSSRDGSPAPGAWETDVLPPASPGGRGRPGVGRRRRRTAGWAATGALAVLAVLGALLFWAVQGHGTPLEVIPAGSTPSGSTSPSEDGAPASEGPVSEELPAGTGAEESAPAVPSGEEPDPYTGPDCRTGPHVPGCPPADGPSGCGHDPCDGGVDDGDAGSEDTGDGDTGDHGSDAPSTGTDDTDGTGDGDDREAPPSPASEDTGGDGPDEGGEGRTGVS